MKKIILPFLLLFSVNLHSAIDSTQVAKLIEKGSLEFCHILDINDEAISSHHPEEMQFVIDVPVDYVHTHLEGNDTSSIFTDHVIKDSLNARIRRIYQQCGIELYIVVINSLDVIVRADLPANITVNDLFVKKLYDEKTNLDTIRQLHDHITQSILAQSLSGHNRDCIVFSDAQYRGCFFANGKKGCWEYEVVSDHTGTPSTYTKLNELQNLFSARLQNNYKAHTGALSYMLPVVVDEFKEAADYFRLEMMIKQAWTPLELDAIFHGFSSTLDYESLTVDDRKHALSVYTGFPMNENWFAGSGPNQEAHAINVIKYTPASQMHQLLYILSQPNELKNNPNYHGDASNDALIKKLIDHIDDVGVPFFSADNYTTLISVITQLELSSEQTCAENLPADDAGWQNRNIEWKTPAVLAPIGTLDYEVVTGSDGKVTVTRKIVSSWNKTGYNAQSGEYTYQPVWRTDATFNLNPFDLIYFTNRSSAGMLEAVGAHQGQICVAPAIILQYAKDKEFNQTALSGAAVALDVLTLVTGPGLIIKAAEAGDYALSAFEALQFLGSSGNIAANTISDPDLQSIVDKYNMIVGIWGLSKIVTSGIHYTVSFYTEAAAGELRTIPAATAQEYENAFHAAGTKVNDLPADVKERVGKMEEYLEGKSGVVGASSGLFNTRTSWLNDLKSQYGNLDFEGFTAEGINLNSVDNTIQNEMLGEMQNLTPSQKQTKLVELITSGSSVPEKIEVTNGTALFKLVPKGQLPSQYTSYWLRESEINELIASGTLEQKCGLPLGSHAVEYDLYKIISNENTVVFESTIAPTLQRGYQTSGGARQSLVLNRAKWSSPIKVNTEPILPNH